MRLRYRRPLAVAAATLLAGVTAVVVAPPAALAATDLCFNHFPTITITSAGSYNGTSGNDIVVIKHTSGTVSFNPVDGEDEICRNSGGGAVTVWSAGDGHKMSFDGSVPVTVYGSAGADLVYASGGSDLVKGNGGNDTLWGYGGDDYIMGNGGDDVIFDEHGTDCLLGGSGYNEVYGYGGNSTVSVGHEFRYSSSQCAPAVWDTSAAAEAWRNNLSSGGGTGYGGNGDNVIYGSGGVDSLTGGAGNDVISGFGGNDSLYGGTGSDKLNGGYGKDRLEAGSDGAWDALYGGPATDTFYASTSDSCYPEWGPATITCGSGVTG